MSAVYLPQTAEYAFRALACIAALPPGEGLRTKDLAELTDAPEAYLSKVMRKLVVAGLLASQKGHYGGFTLARRPKDIKFSEVLEAAAFHEDPNRCAFGWRQCNPQQPCPLHPAWADLKQRLGEWAGTRTLADVQGELPVRKRRSSKKKAAPARGRRPKARRA